MTVAHPHLDLPRAPHSTATGSPDDTGHDARRPDHTPGFRYSVEAMPIDPRYRATIVILRMVGEIDLSTQSAAEAALDSSLQAESWHLLVDLSAVTFCSARGLGTVAETARTADRHRITYAVCGLSPRLRRAAATPWESDGLTRYRSVAAAVTMIRATAATTA